MNPEKKNRRWEAGTTMSLLNLVVARLIIWYRNRVNFVGQIRSQRILRQVQENAQEDQEEATFKDKIESYYRMFLLRESQRVLAVVTLTRVTSSRCPYLPWSESPQCSSCSQPKFSPPLLWPEIWLKCQCPSLVACPRSMAPNSLRYKKVRFLYREQQ